MRWALESMLMMGFDYMEQIVEFSMKGMRRRWYEAHPDRRDFDMDRVSVEEVKC
jgi:hypothetical protein